MLGLREHETTQNMNIARTGLKSTVSRSKLGLGISSSIWCALNCPKWLPLAIFVAFNLTPCVISSGTKVSRLYYHMQRTRLARNHNLKRTRTKLESASNMWVRAAFANLGLNPGQANLLHAQV